MINLHKRIFWDWGGGGGGGGVVVGGGGRTGGGNRNRHLLITSKMRIQLSHGSRQVMVLKYCIVGLEESVR